MNRKISLLFFGLFFSFAIAQSPKEYARKVVEKLSSKELAGRGYTNNGLELAQIEVENQFNKIGLSKYNGSYLQKVVYPINVIDYCSLRLNGLELKYGKDYLVSGFSKTEKATVKPELFNVAMIDSLFKFHDNSDLMNEQNRLAGKAIIFPTTDFPPNYIIDGTSAFDLYRELKMSYVNETFGNDNHVFIEVVPEKLTMDLAQKQKNTHLFTILQSAMPENINEMTYDVRSHFVSDFTTNNIIGYIPGKNPKKKIIITAHYDHLGQVGDAIFPGANDNASGVAMLLSMAKYYMKNKPNYTMVFIAFTGEEAGLIGSRDFVNNPSFDLKDVALVCNFDIVGTGDDGIQIVNSTKFPKMYQALDLINRKHQLLKQIKERGPACNSDQCPFDQKGVPAIFTYTLGGFPYYHDIYDTNENLTLAKFDEVFELYTEFFNTYFN